MLLLEGVDLRISLVAGLACGALARQGDDVGGRVVLGWRWVDDGGKGLAVKVGQAAQDHQGALGQSILQRRVATVRLGAVGTLQL